MRMHAVQHAKRPSLCRTQVKRSRQLEKENKFEQFKRQQKLHPEYAGSYADVFLSTPQAQG